MRVEVDEVTMAVAPRAADQGARGRTSAEDSPPEVDLAALRSLYAKLRERERRLMAT
jgi:hypothetical protein